MTNRTINVASDTEETLIASFKLPLIKDFSTVAMLCCVGYIKTNRKFSVNFHGSKGYVSNVEISCEGQQTNECLIFLESFTKQSGGYKSVKVNVYHSEEQGVRVSTGNDKPRTTKSTKKGTRA